MECLHQRHKQLCSQITYISVPSLPTFSSFFWKHSCLSFCDIFSLLVSFVLLWPLLGLHSRPLCPLGDSVLCVLWGFYPRLSFLPPHTLPRQSPWFIYHLCSNDSQICISSLDLSPRVQTNIARCYWSSQIDLRPWCWMKFPFFILIPHSHQLFLVLLLISTNGAHIKAARIWEPVWLLSFLYLPFSTILKS